MKAGLSEEFVDAARRELRRAGLDGWLLYDLKARNHVAAEIVGLPDGLTRRWFVLVRPEGTPRALAHRIELAYWEEWDHELDAYVGWSELEGKLAALLDGCEAVAMEVSARDAVPILDTVPAGVVELVRGLGVRVESSADLISGTLAQWGERGRELHRQAARVLKETARAAFELAAAVLEGGPAPADGRGEDGRAKDRSGGPDTLPNTEHALASWILEELDRRGLTQQDTIVAVGPNSAKPHYEPTAQASAPLEAGQVLLIDLWGKMAGDARAIVADQTWMGFLGTELPADVADAWDAVRAARDGAVELIRSRPDGEFPSGAEVDRHVRSILEGRGYGDRILHRTGHGIDRETHGFGPNLDSVESRDERRLVPGIGFSVEPGLYFPGRFGLRSEIDVHLREDGLEVSPEQYQEMPWLLG
ncbi:MAG: M24 family metallopeptidase [Gemmatimonadota bacterium]